MIKNIGRINFTMKKIKNKHKIKGARLPKKHPEWNKRFFEKSKSNEKYYDLKWNQEIDDIREISFVIHSYFYQYYNERFDTLKDVKAFLKSIHNTELPRIQQSVRAHIGKGHEWQTKVVFYEYLCIFNTLYWDKDNINRFIFVCNRAPHPYDRYKVHRMIRNRKPIDDSIFLWYPVMERKLKKRLPLSIGIIAEFGRIKTVHFLNYPAVVCTVDLDVFDYTLRNFRMELMS